MITVEHDWTETDPPRVTVCRNCGLVCDTRQDGFVDSETGDVSTRLPPCPLVPESRHTPGPWRWNSSTSSDEYYSLSNGREDVITANSGHVYSEATSDPAFIEVSLDDARLIARAPAMRDALEAFLLFHRAPYWDDECRARWLELTGSEEATTKVLADTVRRALR